MRLSDGGPPTLAGHPESTPAGRSANTCHSPDSSSETQDDTFPLVSALATVRVAPSAGAAERTRTNTYTRARRRAGVITGPTVSVPDPSLSHECHCSEVLRCVTDMVGAVAENYAPRATHAWAALVPPPLPWLPFASTCAQHARAKAATIAGGLDMGDAGGAVSDLDASHYPFALPSGDPQKSSEQVKRVPADITRLRVKPFISQSEHPRTEPTEIPERPTWPPGIPLPMPGAGFTSTQEKWDLSNQFFTEYFAEAKLTMNTPGHRFNYNKVLGGQDGLIITEFLNTDFNGVDLSLYQWDLRQFWASGGKKPAVPLRMEHASLHCDWKLDDLDTDARAAGFTDLKLLQDLCSASFTAASSQHGVNTVILCCNYKGAWEHIAFAVGDAAKRREGFENPRLRGAWPGLPYAPARLHALSVATQESVEGVIKNRTTRDPGGPHRPKEFTGWFQPKCKGGHTITEEKVSKGASKRRIVTRVVETDISWNAGVDLEDPIHHPKPRYATVDGHARNAGILRASGERVVQFKSDLCSFFNQLPLRTSDVPFNLQYIDPEIGVEESLRLEFGNSPNPAISQRVSLLILFLIEKNLQIEEEKWIREEKVPVHVLAWMAERAAVGVTSQFTCLATFIDDTMGSVLEFFADAAIKIVMDTFYLYSIDVADGSMDAWTGVPRKNKFERGEPDGEMEILGVRVTVSLEDEGRSLHPKRADTYATQGEQLALTSKARVADMESFLGRVSFASQALAGVGPLFRHALARLPRRWARDAGASHRHVYVSRNAAATIAAVSAKIRENTPTALHPMEAPLGADRPVTWVFSDAAKKKTFDPNTFAGFGGWVYLEGTDTVYYVLSKWTAEQMLTLDITSLEYFGATATLASATCLHGLVQGHAGRDIIVVGDNQGASHHVGQSDRSSAAPLRALVAARSQRSGVRAKDRLVHLHARRTYNQESDALSNGDIELFTQLIAKRFGTPMKCVPLPRSELDWASMRSAVSANAEHKV